MVPYGEPNCLRRKNWIEGYHHFHEERSERKKDKSSFCNCSDGREKQLDCKPETN